MLKSENKMDINHEIIRRRNVWVYIRAKRAADRLVAAADAVKTKGKGLVTLQTEADRSSLVTSEQFPLFNNQQNSGQNNLHNLSSLNRHVFLPPEPSTFFSQEEQRQQGMTHPLCGKVGTGSLLLSRRQKKKYSGY
jgi:hypothetical protein